MLVPLVSLAYTIDPPAISYALYSMSYGATSNIICFEWYSCGLYHTYISYEYHVCVFLLLCTVSVVIPMVSITFPIGFMLCLIECMLFPLVSSFYDISDGFTKNITMCSLRFFLWAICYFLWCLWYFLWAHQ